jgi:hypothetical protein
MPPSVSCAPIAGETKQDSKNTQSANTERLDIESCLLKSLEKVLAAPEMRGRRLRCAVFNSRIGGD